MANDPAFLFYSADFLIGVQDLTMEERGQYITLLCLQHQKGRLSGKVVGIAVGTVLEGVLVKFRYDENGLLYNERLELEIEKRSAHSKKQRENVEKRWKNTKSIPNPIPNQYQQDTKNIPLENENENINENVFKDKKGIREEKENGDILKTELNVHTRSAVEQNQFTHTQNKNSKFVDDQWMVFLTERLNDPPYTTRGAGDLNRYFANWIRNKFPPKNKKQHGKYQRPDIAEIPEPNRKPEDFGKGFL